MQTNSPLVPLLTVGGASASPKNETSLPATGGATQARKRDGHAHLVIGPVGAGKSTLALELAARHGAARLTLDEWMTSLFRKDRPAAGVIDWYVERAARCVDQIGSVAQALVETGAHVVLEIGLLRRCERERFYRRLDDASIAHTVYVVDAARDVRRERVEQRNRQRGPTFSMVVPPEIFELASDSWEPPTEDECVGRDVRFLRTDAL